MNTLTLTATIDGTPTIFHETRASGESNAVVVARGFKHIAAYVDAGSFTDVTSVTWKWS